jgi:ABC-type amino acid transport system permease subunit
MGYGGEQLLTGPTFAVIPDLRESESLEALKDSAFEQAIGFKPLVISAGSEVESQIGNIRMRHEWTIWLLIAVFIILMMETAWAWFCGREK